MKACFGVPLGRRRNRGGAGGRRTMRGGHFSVAVLLLFLRFLLSNV